MTHPAYGVVRPVTSSAAVLLQANPNPMTLDGTNTWLLRGPGASSTVVVDPGQTDPDHLERLLGAAPSIDLVLVTHGHFDHAEAAAALHEQTGAPVRAIDPEHCHEAPPLRDGEAIVAAGLAIRVLATPGHTADSASFVVGDEAVLTGDTILGRGTTVVAYPDGVLGAYLESLHRLQALGDAMVLTGHGPELPSVRDAAAHYLAHRQERLEQVRAAAESLGPRASARQIVEVVYADVDQAVWGAAELSVRAQLAYLKEHPTSTR